MDKLGRVLLRGLILSNTVAPTWILLSWFGGAGEVLNGVRSSGVVVVGEGVSQPSPASRIRAPTTTMAIARAVMMAGLGI